MTMQSGASHDKRAHYLCWISPVIKSLLPQVLCASIHSSTNEDSPTARSHAELVVGVAGVHLETGVHGESLRGMTCHAGCLSCRERTGEQAEARGWGGRVKGWEREGK